MALFLIVSDQEEMCITPLLGKPLFVQVLESIGKTTESVFIVHKEGSEIAESIHAIDEDIHCIPVKSTLLAEQIAEAITMAESLHLLKEKQITFVPIDYMYTVPILPYIPDENAIVCHPGRGSFHVSLEDEKIAVEEEGLIGSLIHFADVDHLKSVCSNLQHNSWKSLIQHMIEEEEDSFVGIPKVGEEVLQIATQEERAQYEAYVHRFVFALDGVVANFTTFWFSVWAQTLSAFHLGLTTELYQIIVNKSDDAIASFFNLSKEVLVAKKESVIDELVRFETYSLITGFDEIVDLLQRRGHKVHIYSKWNTRRTETVLEILQIPKDLVVYSLEDKTIANDHTILFESTKVCIENAVNKCVKWIVGCPSYHLAEELVQIGADVVLQDFQNPDTIVETLLATSPTPIERISQPDFSMESAIKRMFYQYTTVVDTNRMRGNLSYVYPVDLIDENGVVKVVAKINAEPSERTRIAKLLDVYNREHTFYDVLSRYVSVRVPKYYGALNDNQWKTRGLVLEDVRPKYDIDKSMETEPIDTALKVVSELARMHTQFWGTTNEFPLHFMELPVQTMNDMWSIFEEKWTPVLGTKSIQLLQQCKDVFETNASRLQDKHQTLLHGDVKSANLMFHREDKSIGFLDWQFASLGKGVQDLVFFMIESFSTQKMDVYYSVLKHYYFTKLQESGVSYTWQEYEEDFKAAAAYYPFFVVIWYGSMESNELLDVNFPFFYLRRYVRFLERLEPPV